MTVVVDASAVLCVLFEEPGMERVVAEARGAFISSVNLSEVLSKASDRGVPAPLRALGLAAMSLNVVAFDEAAAVTTADLRDATRQFGLSFADRACLALAQQLGARVLTTDRIWSRLDLGIAVEQMR